MKRLSAGSTRLNSLILLVVIMSSLLVVMTMLNPNNTRIENRGTSNIEGIGGSIHNIQVILWITPWGKRLNPDSFPPLYIPGIIVPYDYRCGLCTKQLINYFNTSMNYIRETINFHNTVFINFFCEKYFPEYTWRGKLAEVSPPPENILVELRRIIGDGEKTFIGYSELSSCVNSDACLDKLIDVFNKLHSVFPKARFFYYGSSEDSVEQLIKLYHRARLDLVGIDIWNYDFKPPHNLSLDDDLASRLKHIADKVGWDNVILGEIGLRIDDEEAYIQPWNWSREIRYNPYITAYYYRSLLEDMLRRGITPRFTGIWSWNDGLYAIDNGRDILEVFDKLIHNRGNYVVIIPSHINASTFGDTGKPYNWVSIGNASIDPCLWGLEEYKLTGVKGGVEMKIVDNRLSVRVDMDPSLIQLPSRHVIGYPEVIYGLKPWGYPGIIGYL